MYFIFGFLIGLFVTLLYLQKRHRVFITGKTYYDHPLYRNHGS